MKTITLIALCLFSVLATHATTVNGWFGVLVNNGTTYSIKVRLQTNAAAGLGGATLAFTFNTNDLSFPASPVSGTHYTFHAFSGNTYSVATVTRPLANKVSVNIEYNGNTGEGTPVVASPDSTDVVTITFATLNPLGHSNLVWVTKEVLADDAVTQWTNGAFPDLDTSPLPVQLSSFTATVVDPNRVRLDWSTISEINNYGFEIQKSQDTTANFQTIPNSFIPGHGTTNQPQQYSYLDHSATSGMAYYRLKQIDLDGTEHFSESIIVGSPTNVKERSAPTVYALEQNYPNPFNPSTTIEFALPKESQVKLEVYNVLGQRVATLVNEMRSIGYYAERFNASGLASGFYIYRISAGDFVKVRKLVLMK